MPRCGKLFLNIVSDLMLIKHVLLLYLKEYPRDEHDTILFHSMYSEAYEDELEKRVTSAVNDGTASKLFGNAQ